MKRIITFTDLLPKGYYNSYTIVVKHSLQEQSHVKIATTPKKEKQQNQTARRMTKSQIMKMKMTMNHNPPYKTQRLKWK